MPLRRQRVQLPSRQSECSVTMFMGLRPSKGCNTFLFLKTACCLGGSGTRTIQQVVDNSEC